LSRFRSCVHLLSACTSTTSSVQKFSKTWSNRCKRSKLFLVLYAMESVTNPCKYFFRREEAANEPRPEFVPKTLTDLNIEPIMDGLNGANSFKKPPPYSQNPPPSRNSTNDANNRAPVQSIGWNVPPAIRKSRKSLTLSGACWWRKRTNKLVVLPSATLPFLWLLLFCLSPSLPSLPDFCVVFDVLIGRQEL
jgi:hypothetical protein